MAGALLRGSVDLPGAMPEIHLPVFEGPLDLLLHLIERDDLDITAVSLVAVADQYLAAIRGSDGVDPQALAEFIAIGAKLLYLKSRALLPRLPEEGEVTLESDEVGRELVDLLREYRRFAEVVGMLQDRQDAGLRLYPRTAPPPALPPGPGLDGVTVDALYRLMIDVLARMPAEPRVALARDSVTIDQQIESFRERLRRYGKFSFRRAISACRSRIEVIVSFMAILELLKGGECDARQAKAWGDIEVVALAATAAS